MANDCPLCAGAREKKELAPWRTWRWWDCAECGIAFCTPFKNPGAGFYQDYADLYPVEATGAPDAMSFEYRECLRSFSGSVDGKKLLDVGCGSGGFLNWARKRGFTVTGLDFDAARLDLVKSKLRIFDVHQGSLLDFLASHVGQNYDVVTMFQVLEHLDQPGAWLESAKILLGPGGRLFLGTPNRDRTFDPFVDGMAQVDNPPNHLTRWRESSLKAFLEKCGFKIVEIRSLPVPLPLYALMLRNKLRFGLAAQTLSAAQASSEAPKTPSGKTGAVRTLVKIKEFLINALAWISYPLFRAAFKILGWEGVVLYCVAEAK